MKNKNKNQRRDGQETDWEGYHKKYEYKRRKTTEISHFKKIRRA